MLRKLATLVVDVMTLLALAAGAYLLAQPQSVLRMAWAAHRLEVASSQAAGTLWPSLAHQSVPLNFTSGEPRLIEISSYDCVFCRQTSPSVDSVMASGVSVAYLHLPSTESPNATGAALAALCAEGSGQFPEMHQRLMTSEDWRRDGNFGREAMAAGILDTVAFARCMSAPATAELLQQHRILADDLHVNVTPTFVTASEVRRGSRSADELLNLAMR